MQHTHGMWKWLERLGPRPREVSLQEAIRALPLGEVLEVVFFKRDEFTTDLICCEITSRDDLWFFQEDWPGWRELIAHLEALPGWRADWFANVSQPPFAQSRTVAYTFTPLENAAPEMMIRATDGALKFGDLATVSPNGGRFEIEAALLSRVKGARDHGNGYAWLYLNGFRFGGHPCNVSLGFFQERLAEVGWAVSLPDAKLEGGWPTREAIDAEIIFVRHVLAEQLGTPFQEEGARFSWGVIWSQFDEKGFMASNGIRYNQRP